MGVDLGHRPWWFGGGRFCLRGRSPRLMVAVVFFGGWLYRWWVTCSTSVARACWCGLRRADWCFRQSSSVLFSSPFLWSPTTGSWVVGTWSAVSAARDSDGSSVLGGLVSLRRLVLDLVWDAFLDQWS